MISAISKDILNYELHLSNDKDPWMVFVHGAGGSTRTWHRQVTFFKGKFNLLLVDLRDHGDSKDIKQRSPAFDFDSIAADVLHVMDALYLREAHFVGVSMGSIIIRHLERMAPERVSSVVLAGGIFKMSKKINVLVVSARVLSNILPFQLLYQIFALVLLPRNNHASSRKVFIREAKKLHNKEVKKWFGLIKKLNRTLKEMFIQKIQAPCLVVMGAQDHVFLEPARQYVERYSEVVLEIIDKCGHVCNIENPHEFNNRCLLFIRKLEQNALKTV